jgi:hypothetical protein
MERVGNQECSHPRSSDDEHLCRLQEHPEISVLQQVAAGHRAEHHDDSDDREHRSYLSSIAGFRRTMHDGEIATLENGLFKRASGTAQN